MAPTMAPTVKKQCPHEAVPRGFADISQCTGGAGCTLPKGPVYIAGAINKEKVRFQALPGKGDWRFVPHPWNSAIFSVRKKGCSDRKTQCDVYCYDQKVGETVISSASLPDQPLFRTCWWYIPDKTKQEMAPWRLGYVARDFDGSCTHDLPAGCRVYWEGGYLHTMTLLPYRGMSVDKKQHFVVLKNELHKKDGSAAVAGETSQSREAWSEISGSQKNTEGDNSRWVFTKHCSDDDMYFITSVNYVRQSASDCDFMLCWDATTQSAKIKRVFPNMMEVNSNKCWWQKQKTNGAVTFIGAKDNPDPGCSMEYYERLMKMHNDITCAGNKCRSGEVCAKTSQNDRCRCLNTADYPLYIRCPDQEKQINN